MEKVRTIEVISAWLLVFLGFVSAFLGFNIRKNGLTTLLKYLLIAGFFKYGLAGLNVL